ncbi:MAG: HAMP domain-containing protein, partial [Actinobacteria bacterium]|nr:HAMP domain-containing protein [Actinomycetota bacterium]
MRLTLLYGGLFLLSGAGLLVITYLLVAHRLPVTATAHAGPGGPAGTTVIYRGRDGCPALSGAAAPGGTLTPAQGQVALGRCLSAQRAAELRQLLTDSAIALAVMTVAAIGLGWLVAGRVLRPLRTITAAARRISASSLHQRLALTGPDDELKELGDTFDGLLARLDASFRAQRQFVANASHELRTPLARQRTVMEVALADPQPTVALLRSACERVLAAGEQQEELIEALLTLARSERGLDRREPFDLREVAAEVLRARQQEAQARGVGLEFAAAAAPAAGDARLAGRLVANLVDNALRHNLPGGRVWLATAAGPGQAVLSVANTGPVIPAERVAELFQPFRRLGGDRPAAREGLGLGLPIVAAIAAAHGAALWAAPRPAGGLTVEIRFASPSDQGWGRPS